MMTLSKDYFTHYSLYKIKIYEHFRSSPFMGSGHTRCPLRYRLFYSLSINQFHVRKYGINHGR